MSPITEAALRPRSDHRAGRPGPVGPRPEWRQPPGGAAEKLYRPTIVDDRLVGEFARARPLAPLHNPPAVLGIEVARKVLPDLPHVAVFDTAFFHDLPAAASTYRHRPRDRGPLATSAGTASTAPRMTSSAVGRTGSRRPWESLNQIVLPGQRGLRLSDRRGPPVDTTMGLTPMENLVMGNPVRRCRPDHQLPVADRGHGRRQIESMLNRRSGMLGLTGEDRLRVVHQRIAAGDGTPAGIRVYVHRLRKYIGAYLVLLGRTDVVYPSPRGGENDAKVPPGRAGRFVGAGHRP